MTDEASLIPCKICGKKFEKVGFHVRKKHSMSMDEYRALPSQEQMPAVAEEKPVAAETSEPTRPGEVATLVEEVPVTTTIDEETPVTPIEKSSEKRPWYKKLIFGLV
jgi:hypothetical protein